MRSKLGIITLGAAIATANLGLAQDFETRIIAGSVQLGGEIVISVADGHKVIPPSATCAVELAEPYASHVETVSTECSAVTLQQGFEPILDEAGYAIPSAQVPYDLVVLASDGTEVGRVAGMYPYSNQFSDLRILLKDVRNPVAPGQSFEAVVLGAGRPIADGLLCRWNTYGPVAFESTSQNDCTGRVTALPADGSDGDIDVEIVNLTDMHAVGYALAKILVK